MVHQVHTNDPKTVGQNVGLPLHPGTEKLYREAGYIRN